MMKFGMTGVMTKLWIQMQLFWLKLK